MSDALSGYPSGWLLALGHMHAYPDYPYQREKAMGLFTSAVDFIRSTTSTGVVLLFDELENICRQWDVRGRRTSYDILQRLLDHSGLFVIGFVTDRLFEQVKSDLSGGARTNWTGWSHKAIQFVHELDTAPILSTPSFTEASARELIGRIVWIYGQAYGATLSDIRIEDLVERWKRTPTRSTRLLVRSTIAALDGVTSRG